MASFVWRPDTELVSQVNVSRLMQRHRISEIEELRRRAAAEPDWSWLRSHFDFGRRHGARIDPDQLLASPGALPSIR